MSRVSWWLRRRSSCKDISACLLFVAEISLHDDRRLNHQLTRDIYIDIVAFIVDNAALRPRPVSIGMPSCGAHAAKLLRTFQRTARDARNLRHAIAADEVRNMEFIPKRVYHAVPRAIEFGDLMISPEFAARALHEYGPDGFDNIDRGGARIGGDLPERGCREAWHDDHACAACQRAGD